MSGPLDDLAATLGVTPDDIMHATWEQLRAWQKEIKERAAFAEMAASYYGDDA